MRKSPLKNSSGKKTFTPLSEEVFQSAIKGVVEKIEYSRKDFGEQLHSVQKSLNTRIDGLDQEIKLTQQALRATKDELTSKIDSVESRLTSKIDSVDARLSSKIDSVESRLTSKIDSVDARLSKKIDSIHDVLDDHEKRITSVETAHL